jgi:hypothetical protein
MNACSRELDSLVIIGGFSERVKEMHFWYLTNDNENSVVFNPHHTQPTHTLNRHQSKSTKDASHAGR